MKKKFQLGDCYTCSYCLHVIQWNDHPSRPTRDHFFPKSKRAGKDKTQRVLCCQPCNSLKSDRVFASIEDVREFIASKNRPHRFPAPSPLSPDEV